MRGIHAIAWSSEDIDSLVQLKAEGVNNEDISIRLGRTNRAIRVKFHKISMGLDQTGGISNRRSWSKEDIAKLVSLRDVQRKTWIEVGIALNRSSGTAHAKYYYVMNMTTPLKSCPSYQKVPAASEQDWRHRQSLCHRSLTAELMGDPLPGYSALERCT